MAGPAPPRLLPDASCAGPTPPAIGLQRPLCCRPPLLPPELLTATWKRATRLAGCLPALKRVHAERGRRAESAIEHVRKGLHITSRARNGRDFWCFRLLSSVVAAVFEKCRVRCLPSALPSPLCSPLSPPGFAVLTHTRSSRVACCARRAAIMVNTLPGPSGCLIPLLRCLSLLYLFSPTFIIISIILALCSLPIRCHRDLFLFHDRRYHRHRSLSPSSLIKSLVYEITSLSQCLALPVRL